MEPRPPHLVPLRSRGLPRWLIAIVGLLIGLGVLFAWFATNLPPDIGDRARTSFEEGRAVGRAAKEQRRSGAAEEPAP